MVEFEEFLSSYPLNVQLLAKRAQALIEKTIPDVQEFVDAPSKIVAYGFSPKYTDLVCAIAPYKNYINLMLSKGSNLSDPEKLLSGTGKSARHVKIEDDKILETPALKNLIEQAILLTKNQSTI